MFIFTVSLHFAQHAFYWNYLDLMLVRLPRMLGDIKFSWLRLSLHLQYQDHSDILKITLIYRSLFIVTIFTAWIL